MRRIIYLLITYPVCIVLGIGHLWPWFALVFISMNMFKIPHTVWWEIPLAVLFCSVLELGFRDNITMLMRVMIVLSSALIAYQTPYKLAIFFPVAIGAVYFDSIGAFAAVWAMLWCAVRAFFVKEAPIRKYSTTE